MREVLNGIFNYSCNNFISPTNQQSETLKKEAPNHCHYDFDLCFQTRNKET